MAMTMVPPIGPTWVHGFLPSVALHVAMQPPKDRNGRAIRNAREIQPDLRAWWLGFWRRVSIGSAAR
jgi:hypothetical protein